MLDELEQSTVPVLISVNICPFVHRAAILLTLKGREYKSIARGASERGSLTLFLRLLDVHHRP